jgi:excisionase family DNA binding protein
LDSDEQRNAQGKPMTGSTIYYTLSQVAELLGVHYETAARWVRTGKLPGVKLSRRKVVVPKENLDTFLAGERTHSGPKEEPAVGSPRRWLALVGTLTPEEAAFLRASVEDFERIEEEA